MNLFPLKDAQKLKNKGILLISAITHESTLDTCNQKLLEIKGVKVSIAID